MEEGVFLARSHEATKRLRLRRSRPDSLRLVIGERAGLKMNACGAAIHLRGFVASCEKILSPAAGDIA